EHPPHLAEDLDHVLDVQLGRRLQPELPIVANGPAVQASRSIHARPYAGDDGAARLVVGDLAADAMLTLRIAASPRRGSVIPEPPIRRARDHAVHRLVRERAQHLAAVADQQTEGAHAARSFLFFAVVIITSS